jgi:putative membrane protein
MNRWFSSAFVVSLMVASSCGGSEPAANAPPPPAPPPPSPEGMESTANPPPSAPNMQPPSTTSPSTTSPATPSTTQGAYGGGAPDPTSAPSASPTSTLSDDQIFGVLHTANVGEIEQARLAQKQAKNVRVKQFAGMMIKDHSDADKKGNDVARKTKASPAPSDVAGHLESEAKQMTSAMSSQKGSDFDKSYIDAQVKEHQAVLDLIEKQLMPNAQSAELKSLLQSLKPKIEGHLREAQDIQKAL